MLQSLKPVAFGLLVGAGLSLCTVVVLTRALTGMLATGSVVLVPVVTVVVVALAAASWPAFAATNLNPCQAIQSRN